MYVSFRCRAHCLLWTAICSSGVLAPIEGCLGPSETKWYYYLDQAEIKKVDHLERGQIRIDYKTFADTVYYSPGVDVERRGERLYVYFVKTSIYRKGGAAYPAKSHGSLLQSVSLPIGDSSAVYATDGRAIELIWKRRNGDEPKKGPTHSGKRVASIECVICEGQATSLRGLDRPPRVTGASCRGRPEGGRDRRVPAGR